MPDQFEKHPPISSGALLNVLRGKTLGEEKRFRTYAEQHHQYILYSELLPLTPEARNDVSAAMDRYADLLLKYPTTEKVTEAQQALATSFKGAGIASIGANIERAIRKASPYYQQQQGIAT